ncbi:hypothetical protein D3C86_1068490 [compost metagenome]
MVAVPFSLKVPSNMVFTCDWNTTVGLSKVKLSKPLKVVFMVFRFTSTLALRFLPTAPNNQVAERVAVEEPPEPKYVRLPMSKLILSLLGITVSILIVLVKVAPPAFTFANQFPVGAVLSVAVLKA